MAFTERQIEITIKLAPNSRTNQPNKFVQTGTDLLTVRGLRTSVRIANSGALSGGRATINIWGLSPSTMNQLSTLGPVYNVVALNTVTVKAGNISRDPSTGSAIAFSGTIVNGYANYDAMPNVPFIIEANSGLGQAIAPADPSSFTGDTSVATIMSGFARQSNLGFENNGVTGVLSNPYFPGNLKQQIEACAKAARIEHQTINGNTLAIWPKGSYRTSQSTTVPVISEQNETLIGAPAFTQAGIIVRAVFNPLVSFGALVSIRSSVLDRIVASQSGAFNINKVPTDSRWAVTKIDHALDAQVPGGQWMSTIQAWNPFSAKPIVR